MRYVGNASLSEQIQERILTTFQQTLGLAQEGNQQEALLGCDFVLRLDPLFEPARQLQARLNETEGPVEITDLAEAVATEGDTTSTTPSAEPEVSEALEPELPEPSELTESSGLPEIEDTFVPVDELPGKMAWLLEQRNFEELRTMAKENQDRLAADPSLQQIAKAGVELLEAQPYVDSFLESTEKAKEAGDIEAARGHLEKARGLDPTHPKIAGLEADLAGTASATFGDTLVAPPIDDVLAGALVDDSEATSSEVASSEPDWPDPLAAPSGPVETLFEPPAQTPVESPDELPARPPMAESVSELDFDSTLEPLEPFEPVESVAPETVMAQGGEPAAHLGSEIEGRIDQLLGEGQETFEKGEYQTAIDAWSRIFLIDIDHAEASRRIELARKLKAEVERQIEEAFHEGIQLIESGKKDEAIAAFEKVLEMHPGHMGAREYLDRMATGVATPAAEAGEEATPELAPPSDVETDEDEVLGGEAPDELELAPDLTPEPAVAEPAPEPQVVQEAKPGAQRRKRSFALIGTAVLVVVLAVGWILYSKRQSIFPNSDTQQQQDVPRQVDPIERARELHEEGKTAMAVNVLRRLPPSDEYYSEAQSLIEAWQIIDSPGRGVDVGPSEDDLLRRDALLEGARTAAKSRENLAALDLLEQAESISQLEGEDQNLRFLLVDKLDVVAEEIALFEQGDWEYALPGLWRLHEEDDSNRDVRRLMVDSYYNLGLRDLQRGDTNDASEKFQEALQLEPGDAELQRLSDFADAYSKRPSDLLYRIFVKYHPFR